MARKKKRPNEVDPFQIYYIRYVYSINYKEINLLADNYPRQNKNNAIIPLCLALTDNCLFS